MSEERDPLLQAAFIEAEQDFPAEPFTAGVITKVHKVKTTRLLLLCALALMFLLLAGLFAAPLQAAGYKLVQLTTASFYPLSNNSLAAVLMPVNNMGSLFLLVFFSLRMAYKKIF